MTDLERVGMMQSQAHDTLPGHLLREVDCPVCRNTGLTFTMDNGIIRSNECSCMARRRTLLRVRKSGLADLVSRYTFESFKTPSAWQNAAMNKAQHFVVNGAGWFFISGNPGSGKTHLCISIVGEFIKGGKEAVYMMWREDAPRLKAMVNDRDAYEREMKRMKLVDVLYIDDFLKGNNVTDADINLAFELLNARYNDSRKLTIISTEKSLEDILSIDEAIGSRIYERSKGFCIRTPDENWRLKA